jgi:signal transduction histidine kinase/integral membrane sensor domain MASE1/CheY-like chemotaxis protein
MLLWGYRLWPAIFLAAFLANIIEFINADITVVSSVLTSSAIAAGNTLEAVTGAYLVIRFTGSPYPFTKWKDSFIFIFFAAIFATAISATIGASSICFWDIAGWEHYRKIWWIWWLGDTVGALILTPLILVWNEDARLLNKRDDILKIGTLLILLPLISIAIFKLPEKNGILYHAEYLLILVIILAIFLIGRIGASTATFIIGSIAVLYTLQGAGPFAVETQTDSLLLLQTFMAAISIMSILLAAVLSEQKDMEGKLSQSNHRLFAILDSINALIYVADMETYEVLFVNKFGKDTWGDISGQTCWKALQKGQTGPCEFCTNKHLVDVDGHPKGVYTWEFQNTVTGQWYYIHDKAIKWIDGRIVRLEIATDITKHKRMEEELLKAQKLESLGVLAGGIAHDFNNLLTAITNNLFLMKKHISPEEKVYERIIATEKASARAQGLTQQLLTFSKGGSPIKGLIDIRELVSESISIALRGSNVRCDNLIPYDVWHVEADAGQMNQAINNILINSDQSMPEGGTITINCENMIVGAENNLTLTEGNYTKLSIRDQGIGISDEDLSRIFDPYFTTKQKGSGLGLSTTYSIIKKHDGHIDVESELGVGTVFNIYLPASSGKMKINQTAEDEQVTGTGKVLIMDDEELVRDSLGQMLISIGYIVEFACDGREAVDIYKNAMASYHPFDAVIMDLTIPGGMGGKKAIRELIKIDPNVKAIVSSGYSYDPIMANYSDYGFSAVLTKPYKDIRELNRILNNVIDGEVK